MNVNIKQKLAGKSAYIALALLLAAILVFTVVAIVATVSRRDEPDVPPIENNGDNQGDTPTTPGGNDDQPTGGEPSTPNQPDEPTGGDPVPETPVYAAPCAGFVQKDFSEDTLVFSQTMNDHRVHLGIDIAGKVGDPVLAFSNGVIEKIYSDPFMGKTVIINHGNGLKSVYMNLAETIPDGIKEGTEVKVGTVIGAIGETAISECADTPHLHFEVRLSDKKVDPKDYVTLPSSSDSDEVYEG